MKKIYKFPLILLTFAALSLTACGGDGDVTTDVPPSFDINEFSDDVNSDIAQQWVIDSINTARTKDGVRINSNVEKFAFESAFTGQTSPTSGTVSITENIRGSLFQRLRVTGLKEKNANNIAMSYMAKDLDMIIAKNGINPSNKDRVKIDDATIDMYVKNNNQYVDISDPVLRESFPYLLYAFGDYKNIDDAKEVADKAPSKFYDPTPIFKDKDLPLIDKMNIVKDGDVKELFKSLIEVNNEADNKFLFFKTDGDNLLLKFDLNLTIIKKLVVKYFDSIGKPAEGNKIALALQQVMFVDTMEYNFVFNKAKDLKTQKMIMEVKLRLPIEDEPSGKHGLAVVNFDIDTTSSFNYEDTFVFYPEDIASYQRYDIVYPNIKDMFPNL